MLYTVRKLVMEFLYLFFCVTYLIKTIKTIKTTKLQRFSVTLVSIYSNYNLVAWYYTKVQILC